MRTQIETIKLLESGKTRMTMSRDSFSFASDWLRGWDKFSKLITEQFQ